MRQGPHQGAQKSTSTGTLLFSTSSSNVESVTEPAFLGPAAPPNPADNEAPTQRRLLLLLQVLTQQPYTSGNIASRIILRQM